MSVYYMFLLACFAWAYQQGMIQVDVRWIDCEHEDLVHIRKVFGDEINAHGGARNEYLCENCGELIYK